MLQWWKKRNRATSRDYALLFWGIILTVLGAIGTVAFLHEIQNGRKIPPGQIAARLILPHVALLAGLGLMLAAVILLRKHAIMQERRQDDSPKATP
ncbi:MAG: hypothetical protein ACNA71_10140 [Kiritimatiellia bacterium]